MTGYPELNYPAFRAAAEHLRNLETQPVVYNPAEWEELHGRKFDLIDAFVDYCNFILRDADMVVVLPGWELSPGANAEVALARAVRKDVFAYSLDTGWESL
jgi:hypothetical protein